MPAEQNYHVTEQELLADMEALKAFCCYVDGIPFNLITDHKPDTLLDTQRTALQLHMGLQTRRNKCG